MITGARSWSGSFTVTKAVDPNLAVGEIVWLEEKEPSLMRPITRMRWRVSNRTEDGDCVSYEVEKPTPA